MASTSIREVTTSATLEEKKKLRKEFNYFDMIFYTLSALIGLDTLGAFSANGEQALTWTVIAAIFFLLPYGLLTAEIGSTFTQEGGMYEWCKLAGGRFFAAIGAMLYWISNPLWVGGSLSVAAIAAIKLFWFGSLSYKFGGSSGIDAVVEMAIALVFIWGTTWCAIMSLKFGKWLSVFGSYIKLTLLALFVVLALVFIISGKSHGANLNPANLVPSNFNLIVSVLLPIIIFQFVGFELQNGAGEEMHNPQRDVPRAIIRSGIITVVAYGAFLVFILLALPKSQLTNVGGFDSAYQSVSTVLPSGLANVLGWLVGLAIVFAVASSGGTWIIGADRTYAISSLDRTAPRFLGRFSGRYGTPIAVNTMSGIVATITMAVAISITEFATSGGNLAALFAVVIGFTISTTTLSYLFIFPSYLILRYKYPNVHRPYRVPGGMVGAWIVTLFPLAFAAIGSYFILIPATISVAGINKTTYIVTQFVALGVIFLLAAVFYVWGHLEKRNQDVVVELNLETMSEVAVSAGGE
jgi:glutamate:GABA antiporter